MSWVLDLRPRFLRSSSGLWCGVHGPWRTAHFKWCTCMRHSGLRATEERPPAAPATRTSDSPAPAGCTSVSDVVDTHATCHDQNCLRPYHRRVRNEKLLITSPQVTSTAIINSRSPRSQLLIEAHLGRNSAECCAGGRGLKHVHACRTKPKQRELLPVQTKKQAQSEVR